MKPKINVHIIKTSLDGNRKTFKYFSYILKFYNKGVEYKFVIYFP